MSMTRRNFIKMAGITAAGAVLGNLTETSATGIFQTHLAEEKNTGFKLGFGMMRLPVKENNPDEVKYQEACDMVDTYLKRGGVYFDTSYVYQNGHNEETVRKVLVERHKRENFELATKLPSFLINDKNKVKETFEEQLHNLGVDYFDCYLLHSIYSNTYDSKIIAYDMFDFGKEMKRQGKVRKFGFSFHDRPEVLDRVLTEHPETDFVQLVVNYYDWESPFINARKCYEIALKHEIPVFVMEPVKGGLLSRLPDPIHEKLAAMNPAMSDASYGFRFAAGLEGVYVVLSGMSSPEQVRENTHLAQNFAPLRKQEEELLFASVAMYKEEGPLKRSDFSIYDDICENGMPVSGVLDAYNSIMVQQNRGFAINAENGYYRGLQFLAGREMGKSWIEGRIIDREGNDITDLVREAESYLITHTFL